MYDVFIPPPSDCCINKKSRPHCPITDQQFAIARRCENTDFDHVRSEVLDILHRYDIYITAMFFSGGGVGEETDTLIRKKIVRKVSLNSS